MKIINKIINWFDFTKDNSRQIEKKEKIIIFSAFLFLFILSLFRFALYDELLYLRETVLMSELIKKGVWFGNYAVGVHGFLFKLPVALIYTITGPSIFVATFFHVILATLSAWIFYKILHDNLKLKAWSLVGLLLLIFNYSFVSWAITFHRETPSLFAILLFLRAFLSKKSNFILGLSLLLVLEAKEYVFFIISPALVVWLGYYYYKKHTKIVPVIKNFIVTCFVIFIPSLIYTLLMFFTSAIPVNMFLASLLNLTQNGLTYQLEHLEPINYVTKDVGFIAKNINNASNAASNTLNFIPFISNIWFIFSYLVGYFEKIFYQFLFSFQAIPMAVLIPSLVFSYRYLFSRNRSKKYRLIFLILLFWFFVFVFFIKVSHQRYLQPFIPLALIFFVFFLKELYEKMIPRKLITLLCFIISIISVLSFFYPGYDIYRKFYNLSGNLIIVFFIYFYSSKNKKSYFYYLLLSIYALFLAVVLIASVLKNQFNKSLTWGVNGEGKKIASFLKNDDIVMINRTGISSFDWNFIISFYRKDLSLDPEWRWKLIDSVPKKSLIKNHFQENTFYFGQWSDLNIFKRVVRRYKANKIAVITSTFPNVKFSVQDKVEELKRLYWLHLEKELNLKNKKLFIFKVL